MAFLRSIVQVVLFFPLCFRSVQPGILILFHHLSRLLPLLRWGLGERKSTGKRHREERKGVRFLRRDSSVRMSRSKNQVESSSSNQHHSRNTSRAPWNDESSVCTFIHTLHLSFFTPVSGLSLLSFRFRLCRQIISRRES